MRFIRFRTHWININSIRAVTLINKVLIFYYENLTYGQSSSEFNNITIEEKEYLDKVLSPSKIKGIYDKTK